MEMSDMILKRRSIRKWKPKPVEREKLEKILEVGRRAPSASNVQPWRFIVVQDKTKISKFVELAFKQPVIATAPVVIICWGRPQRIFLRNCAGKPQRNL